MSKIHLTHAYFQVIFSLYTHNVYIIYLNLLANKNQLCACLGISRDTSDINLVRNNLNQVEECHYEPINKKSLCIK